MNIWRRFFLCVFLALLIGTVDAVERLPVEAFASLPEMQDVQLSPDGKRIAALMNVKGDTYLITRESTSTQVLPVVKTDNKRIVINWFHWKGNERLVVSLRAATVRFNHEILETRLASYRFDGTKVIDLNRNELTGDGNDPHRKKEHVSQFQDHVIDWMWDDPNHILLEVDAENYNEPSVYMVDVNTGSRSTVHHTKEDVRGWVADRQHRVRVGIKGEFSDTGREIIITDPEEKSWRTAWSFDSLAENAVKPLGFGLDSNILFVRANHDGRGAIFTVDLRDPQLTMTLKESNPDYDIDGDLIYSPRTGDVVGVGSRNQNGHYIFWDEKYKALAAGIDKALTGRRNYILGFSDDESRYLLQSSGDTSPEVYYFGDRNAKQLIEMGYTYPALKSEFLAGKKVVHYKARDGLDIQAYLTIPKNVEAKNLPTIIFPHGHPIAEDGVDFDYWAEFFANRGYAVLQMDFRGSAGYGYDFKASGLKQWGLLHIQDDVTDGVRWLIAQGIVDEKRIGIVGANFGGYAALVGVAKTPELYRCAVSFAAISDLPDYVSHWFRFDAKQQVERSLGDYWKDSDLLKANSPRFLADKIRAPILLVHGMMDRDIPFSQSENMADALKRAGKTYQFIPLESGDHYLSNNEDRIHFFDEMDKFLANCLGTPANVTASNQQPL